MKSHTRNLSIAALAIAIGLASASQAQDNAAASREDARVAAQRAAAQEAQRKELDAARAELQRAARRMAELSRADEMAAMRQRIERRPMLGVLLAPDSRTGVRVTGVTPDSGAARVGLRSGDQLLKINGKAIAGGTPEQRLENARAALSTLKVDVPVKISFQRDGGAHDVQVTPQAGRPVLVFTDDGSTGERGTRIVLSPEGEGFATVDNFDFGTFDFNPAELAITPDIQRELMRVRELTDCTDGKDCLMPRLAEAYRWNGLNLSSVDPQLGRYFGTDSGVLVLSTGPELEGLQAGDVIRRIEGRDVATPREVMEALRGKPVDSAVKVEYLRDRRTATSSIRIPRAMPLRIPAPPSPPAPPAAPPTPASPVPPAPPAPPAAAAVPAPPAPPTPPVVISNRRQHVVMVDRDGRIHEYSGDARAPFPRPPAPPTAPRAPAMPKAPPAPPPPPSPGVPV
ncbi:PDZ domain-containing protein [Pseudoxanthomonas sp. z9]|uniref:PDZ domain-containing protein n=1 Tax=Pseudoxanthomonas sp. z9 TaxID=2584942 RepID=UPI0015E8BD3B|nr:PDZ domain-containing protein [Pseudoxanthomonas sp. z9]